MKRKLQVPDEAAKLAARVVAHRRLKEHSEEVVRIQDHWYLVQRSLEETVKECITINLAEARRLLLHWGFSPMEVYNLTQTALS